MKRTVFILVVLCTSILFAQEHDNEQQKLQHEVTVLKEKLYNQGAVINRQKAVLNNLFVKTKKLDKRIDFLKSEIQNNSQHFTILTQNLDAKIQQTEAAAKDGILRLNKGLTISRLYWIIGVLITLLLGGFVYWFLGKRITGNKTDVETQIMNTRKYLEEEAIKLDSKLIEVLEAQIKLKQEEKQTAQYSSKKEIDHSLALKVADEIIRIQKNLHQMDENTRGLKQLSASVKRIQDNFASNGYELVEMLGKEYHEGMKVVANFIPNEDLDKGKQIITRIIKPQVNFKGQMIQSAQIEVSVGE